MKTLKIFWFFVNASVVCSLLFMFGLSVRGELLQQERDAIALERLNAYYEKMLF